MSATTATATNQPQPDPASSSPQDIPQQQHRAQQELPSPTPVEMSSLASTSQQNPSSSPPANNGATEFSAPSHARPARTDTSTAIDQSMNPPPPPPSTVGNPQSGTSIYTTAIGPSSDSPVVPAKDGETAGPTLTIALLLTSGARHPFRLDGKYLTKRNVDIPANDPFNLSVYKLKELILREWREEWEARPSSPNYIRLISMGRLLDDKAPLKDYKFSTESPNVLHMTIKPQDYVEEEDTKGPKSNYSTNREAEGRSPGCRCIIM
ncbi:uncharacterized protein Z518_05141 [Rhinocladiella mackenziei CBS 650.93]|uniref:UBL3-like ubiquitin domain-containing protein n=1 Tax=Rhinocladiella mackenziei CBS 650.93 TaxID=1442369 RepID=A0A0D2IEM3_9EURO|nr:uncharacterized protein Z518_05141 [Rhinocladiella mackenziei CBS 650.93]KIX04274.1 hypothetical protein Z518_05141 [Rhinocladiella mackenziei CBS 650.93]